MRLATASQSRAFDGFCRSIGLPEIVLMENAGVAAAREILARCPGKRRFFVACGPGNNGGDGFVIARHLANAGMEVEAVLFGERARAAASCLTNLEVAEKLGIVKTAPAGAEGISGLIGRFDCIVDALLGTGLSSDVRGAARDVIEAINACSKGRVVAAVDIPSGLDSDTGAARGAVVKADFTITFGIPKVGLYMEGGRVVTGEVLTAGIGADQRFWAGDGDTAFELIDRSCLGLPKRKIDYHKGDAGHLLIIAGSRDKPGAALMAGHAAMRAGLGLCTLAAPREMLDNVSSGLIELMGFPLECGDTGLELRSDLELDEMLSGKNAVAIGPGIAKGPSTLELIFRVLERFEGPIVLDADALNLIAGHGGRVKQSRAKKIMTPHPGEMARLLGCSVADVQSDRIGAAARCSSIYGAVALLKGATTIIADSVDVPVRVFLNVTGNPGMATGGMGDVLTGVTGALAAQGARSGETALGAAIRGAYINGVAGDIAARRFGQASMIAPDVISCLPDAFTETRGSEGDLV